MMKPEPIKGTAAEASDYFLNETGQDAFGENDSCWFGRFAEGQQLDGKVRREDFIAAFEGFRSDGEKITRNAGKMTGKNARDPGWDLMFAPPKSVSVVWSVAPQHTKAKILAAHQLAVIDAMHFAESKAVVRFGAGGKVREQACIQAAMFQHYTSRETDEHKPDPQLHTHALLFNNAFSLQSGKMGAIHSFEFFYHRKAIEAVYEQSLSSRIEKLGFGIEQGAFGWEIRGISFDIINEFSQRKQQIDKHTDNSDDPEKRRIAVYSTRREKRDYDKGTLEKDWSNRAAKYGVTSEYIESLAGKELKSTVTLSSTNRDRGDPQGAASDRREEHIHRKGLTLVQ